MRACLVIHTVTKQVSAVLEASLLSPAVLRTALLSHSVQLGMFPSVQVCEALKSLAKEKP